MTAPPPPTCSFASDNAAGVLPEVMDAMARANSGPALAYGDDDWTRAADAAVADRLGAATTTLLCWGGTGANVVGLGSVLLPHQAVVTPRSAHIVEDECGAPAHFSGSSIIPVDTPDGKLRPDDLEPYATWLGVEHHPQPAVVSISQATESGTLYSLDELGELCDAAHRHSMVVHLDGARIANALAATDADLTAMVADTGVDVATLGLTKAGAMYGEAVVFLRPELAERARFVRKQAGQLSSKTRFIAAQFLALLADDLWIEAARHANEMAAELEREVRRIPGVDPLREPEVNSVFVRVPPGSMEALQRWSVFWAWDPAEHVARWMTSFATTRSDVQRFAAGIEHVLETLDDTSLDDQGGPT